MKKCITYQTEPKHVVIIMQEMRQPLFIPSDDGKNPMPGLRGGGGL